MNDQSHCKRCGQCCRNNGLIPPLMPSEDAPPWLWSTVNALRELFADRAEDWKCLYLAADNTCNIYEDRPRICREFRELDATAKCEIYAEEKP